MAQFRYVDDAGQLQTIDLQLDEISLGRAASCDIVLIDELISREHARLTKQTDGRWLLTDLGSRNKTHVNGQAITQKVLAAGDVVRLGTKALEFVDEADAAVAGGEIDFFLSESEAPEGTTWVKSSSPMTIVADQLEQLVGIAEVDAFTDRPEPIADRALTQLAARLRAERGFIALCGEDRRTLRLVAARSLVGQRSDSFKRVSEGFAQSAHLQGVAGLYPSERRNKADEGVAGTAIVAPLRHGGRNLGVVYLDRPSDRRRFSQEQLQLLMLAGVQLGGIFGQLHRRLIAAQETESEARLTVLRRHQAAINVTGSGSSETMQWSGQVLDGTERCGDLFGVLPVDDNRLLAVAVDAGGAGVGGIIQGASMLNSVMTAVSLAGPRAELGRILNAVNSSVTKRRDRQPLALVALWIDLVAGRATYVNAGHAAPILLAGPTRLITLDQTALLLGSDGQAIYKATAVDLPARFRIVLVSDGVLEAFDKTGQAFGDERLHEALLDEQAFAEPQAIVDRINAALANHTDKMPQIDDGLILAIAKE
jgi:serine phosphatase RsbU (regulator of sigma subunit)